MVTSLSSYCVISLSALAIALSDLFALAQQEPVRCQRIALIGLRGAGKTTLGSMLAEDLHTPFIEIDQEIEQESGLPLGEIFTLYGQAGYRRIERRCLEHVIKSIHARSSRSAAAWCRKKIPFSLLLSQCHTVWLRAKPDEHMARVLEQGDLRP